MSTTYSNRAEFESKTPVLNSLLLRYLLIFFGTIFLILGVIGIFLPVLPTTPFLLLTASCYAKGSTKFYDWLLNSRYFGSYIKDWRIHGSVRLKTKIIAILMMSISIISSILFFIPFIAGKICVALISISVILYLYRMPTR